MRERKKDGSVIDDRETDRDDRVTEAFNRR